MITFFIPDIQLWSTKISFVESSRGQISLTGVAPP